MRPRLLLVLAGAALGAVAAVVLHAVLRVDPSGVRYEGREVAPGTTVSRAYESSLTITYDKVPPAWLPLTAVCVVGGLILGGLVLLVAGRRTRRAAG